jgi:Protein of unknown function (DUF1634)
MADPDRTPILDAINRLAVLASMCLLGLGLLVWIAIGDRPSRATLDLGLVLLMATPALRVGTTLVVGIRRRDALAVASTIGVVLVLGWTMLLAIWH